MQVLVVQEAEDLEEEQQRERRECRSCIPVKLTLLKSVRSVIGIHENICAIITAHTNTQKTKHAIIMFLL